MWIDDQILKNCSRDIETQVFIQKETLVVLGNGNNLGNSNWNALGNGNNLNNNMQNFFLTERKSKNDYSNEIQKN